MIKGTHHTKETKRKIAESNKRNRGENIYAEIGAKGGRISRGGGFTGNPELARRAAKLPRKKRKNTEFKKLLNTEIDGYLE